MLHSRMILVLFVFAITAANSVALASTKNEFVEFVVTLDSVSTDGSRVIARVDSVYRLKNKQRIKSKNLYTIYPTSDLTEWGYSFKPVTQTFELKREVTSKQSRGWLFWGGRGETVTLEVPEEGWTIRCFCPDKRGRVTGGSQKSKGFFHSVDLIDFGSFQGPLQIIHCSLLGS